MIRFFDIVISLLVLIIFSPFLLTISLAIALDGKGGVLFCQQRVGRDGKEFRLFKFRSMRPGSHLKAPLTVGEKDSRITKTGYLLRKYKLDELPQFFNVLKNDMSIVGPRPEVAKFVNLYTPDQKKILTLKPGITDYASIKYKHENALLAQQSDPEEYYIKTILPDKLQLSLKIVNLHSREYFVIIIATFYHTVFRR
jgi:lipopolysaccharide/colanic/teichoic acid biosynthesis glycosyltransferase